MSYAQIAKVVGLPSAKAVASDLARALEATAKMSSRELELAATLEHERLNMVQQACDAVLRNASAGGDPAMVLKAAGKLLQVSEHRNAMLTAAAALPQPVAPSPFSPLEKARMDARRKLRAVV
jgi:hypothetical protein